MSSTKTTDTRQKQKTQSLNFRHGHYSACARSCATPPPPVVYTFKALFVCLSVCLFACFFATCDCYNLSLSLLQEETLAIPVHAYPAASTIELPRTLDFGITALGSTVERQIVLSSNSPTALHFSLLISPPSAPHNPTSPFLITPPAGDIKPNSSALISVVFRASKPSTATCKLTLHLSQLFSKPLQCLISGSGAPGVTRDAAIKAERGGVLPRDMRQLDGDDILSAAVQRASKHVQPQQTILMSPKPPRHKLAAIKVCC
jgi:hypothetical protein